MSRLEHRRHIEIFLNKRNGAPPRQFNLIKKSIRNRFSLSPTYLPMSAWPNFVHCRVHCRPNIDRRLCPTSAGWWWTKDGDWPAGSGRLPVEWVVHCDTIRERLPDALDDCNSVECFRSILRWPEPVAVRPTAAWWQSIAFRSIRCPTNCWAHTDSVRNRKPALAERRECLAIEKLDVNARSVERPAAQPKWLKTIPALDPPAANYSW